MRIDLSTAIAVEIKRTSKEILVRHIESNEIWGILYKIPNNGYSHREKYYIWKFNHEYEGQILSEIGPYLAPEIELSKPRIIDKGLSRKEFFEHQNTSLNFIMSHNYCAMFSETGTGKTPVAIEAAMLRKKEGKINSCLVVCPNVVLYKWAKEIETWSDANCTVITGSKKKREDCKEKKTFFYIVGYDSVGLTKWLNKKTWGMIILDESQYIRTPTTKRTKSCLALKGNYKLIMTGTPLGRDLRGLYTQYEFLCKGLLGRNVWAFDAAYSVYGGYLNYQIVGHKNFINLFNKISPITISFFKEECMDLPNKLISVIPVEMNDDVKKYYKKATEDIRNASNPLTACIRWAQVCSGSYNGCYFRTNKDDITRHYISMIDDLVVWCRFRDDIERVAAIARQCGKNVHILIGGGNPKKNQQVATNFQTQGGILIGQISMGVGIDLQRSHRTLFYSIDWSYINFAQAMDRIHRHGQTQLCSYLILLTENSIEEETYNAILKKQKLTKAIILNHARKSK